MSYSGEVYAEVEASVVNNGISPMAMVSGNPEPIDGQAYVVVWIRWRYDDTTGHGGYTGTGWYFDDPNNGLSGYFLTEQDFYTYLTEKKPNTLDDYIGGTNWSAEKKSAFLNAHLSELENGGCLYFTANAEQ